ncbi:CDP-diacylglycerol--glycerol-3-phosphate 3-phosphatidyltransferase, mitochondrial isoform X2 [Nematostella vectensis]|uniref:CDP-diacylglycerol--glycerol-3-phosphate 3-phosphatidyltransferase, mitochondrial isoform X2 n=1 Tax=Nematostella vectensis TaxID=45351 RepID=UPI0013905049|nr:CDP-diacylglycerol--glycerol-3-phosphate 3-phosphatidyltransferase, mitochondrial isoform X2 [Nematostella vectensis]
MAAARSILFSVFGPRISQNSLRYFSADNPNCLKATNSSSPKEIVNWMCNHAAIFRVANDAISVMTEPAYFFETLKDNIKSANRRIVLASLYLGTGPLEKELEFSDSVRVSLYHSPELRGLIKRLLPERFNETVALTHLKVYLTDDTVIMSGANLSNDYFTNRQDRYIEIKNSPEVADFFHELVSSVSDISLQLHKDDTTHMLKDFAFHPSESNKTEFITKATERLKTLVHSCSGKKAIRFLGDKPGTWVVPLLQMYPYSIRQDEYVTSELLGSLPEDSKLLLASGYFNLTKKYIDLLLHSAASCHILTAHPTANGFYMAKGIAGGIPDAYTQIAREFFRRTLTHHHRITIWEYARQHWTFHVKGLWYYPPNHALPCLTLIGSPNFGYRSVYRDLEAQVAIVTEDKDLQARLHEEQKCFYARGCRVTYRTFEHAERRVPVWVYVVTKFIKKFL